MPPSFQAEVEARMQHQLKLQDEEASHSCFRDEITTKETKRFQAKIHSTHALRADSLDQLRHWAKPTPDIYLLASLLYKLVALETPSAMQLVDVWRWLPWSILQTVFRNDLVQTLQAVPIADLSPRSLAVLYLHCAQPRFNADAIEERSAVGSALRMWVHNIAAVHDIVDPSTLRVKGIDSLRSGGVSCRDMGALVLLLHVYPHVNVKVQSLQFRVLCTPPHPLSVQLKDCTKYTAKQAKARQEDLVLLRELYAELPPRPSRKDMFASMGVDSAPTSALIGMLDLPDFKQQAVPKSRSKLAARLAARLRERHESDDAATSPRVMPKEKGLHGDFAVVYKLCMPPKLQENALNPVNYIQQKRHDSIRKQATPWAAATSQRPSRSSSLKSSTAELAPQKSTAMRQQPLAQHVEVSFADEVNDQAFHRTESQPPFLAPPNQILPHPCGIITDDASTVPSHMSGRVADDVVHAAVCKPEDAVLDIDPTNSPDSPCPIISPIPSPVAAVIQMEDGCLGDNSRAVLDQACWSDDEVVFDEADADHLCDDGVGDVDVPLTSSRVDDDLYNHEVDAFEP
ncbi:hypothetical protein DYB32_003534 [Aphanomyces invadans]|uniref:Uncharacterized protein n=1 Tax=Aphanomyces invadans TaxID=157072 RepID=A0A418B6N2_9STRA|nr:hypothetical protein DYB32_003534 [Aphanomyces invadans]